MATVGIGSKSPMTKSPVTKAPNIVAHAPTCLPNIGDCTGDFDMEDSVVGDFVMGDFVAGGFFHGGFCRWGILTQYPLLPLRQNI